MIYITNSKTVVDPNAAIERSIQFNIGISPLVSSPYAPGGIQPSLALDYNQRLAICQQWAMQSKHMRDKLDKAKAAAAELKLGEGDSAEKKDEKEESPSKEEAGKEKEAPGKKP